VPRAIDGQPLALQIVDGDSVRWLDVIAGRFEVALGAPSERQALAALKFVAIGGTTVPFHSDEVPLGPTIAQGSGQEVDDAPG
jgi:hypothetical protein